MIASKRRKISIAVFLVLFLALVFPCSVGITGTSTRQTSADELTQVVFIQEPYFGMQLPIGRKIITIEDDNRSAAGTESGTASPAGGYTIRKIDSGSGTELSETILDYQPTTVYEAVTMGLPAKDFVRRFLAPGIFQAGMIAFFISALVWAGLLTFAREQKVRGSLPEQNEIPGEGQSIDQSV